MPVFQFHCDQCGHRFAGLVLEGTRQPEKWICSACGGDQVAEDKASPPRPHPLEQSHGSGCPCCR